GRVRPLMLAVSTTNTTVFAAFAVGVVSFVSPCVLPLVPGYLSAVSGVSLAEIRSGERSLAKLLIPSFIFCLSFTVMFVLLGMGVLLLTNQYSWLNARAQDGLNTLHLDFFKSLYGQHRSTAQKRPSLGPMAPNDGRFISPQPRGQSLFPQPATEGSVPFI